MVHIERTPLKMILRAVVYQNTEKLSLSEMCIRDRSWSGRSRTLP